MVIKKDMIKKRVAFRKWLRDEKNIDDRVLYTLGTKGTWLSYWNEYNKSLKRKTPIRHVVHPYMKDDGTRVRQHAKGKGTKVTYRKGSIIPEYLEEQIMEKDIDWQISELERIKEDGKISLPLERAINETINALKSGNIALAAELTSVKSYVSGSLKSSRGNHFNEDADYNKKALGRDVYGILDTMHHNLAFASGTIPSGVTIFGSTGVGGAVTMTSREPPTAKSPTLNLIKKEHDAIYKEVKRRYEK